MVPWWTLILLTAGFFIREVYHRSRVKPTDYDSGYRHAINEVIRIWNKDIDDSRIIGIEPKLKKFLESKKGW